jgi:hypothetical protein
MAEDLATVLRLLLVRSSREACNKPVFDFVISMTVILFLK